MRALLSATEIVDQHSIRHRGWKAGQQYLNCPQPGCQDNRKLPETPFSFKVEPDGHAVWKCWRCNWTGSTRSRQWVDDGPLTDTPENWERRITRQRREGQAPAASVRVEPVPPAEGKVPERVVFGNRHQEFWDRCQEITADDVVGRYLIGRCCALPVPGAHLRWLPSYRHHHADCDWRGPCMVGLITDVLTGEPTSFHYTWIQPDGSSKAPIAKPRLLAKGMSKMGGVIRLSDPADLATWLIVGEGVETVLSALPEEPGRHAWSCIDSGNMASLPIPEWLDDIVILVDHDRPNKHTGRRAGTEAADELARRCDPVVLHVRLNLPDREGDDWNNVVIARSGTQMQRSVA